MAKDTAFALRIFPRGAVQLLRHPGFTVFLPAAMLCSFLLGGEAGLLTATLCLTLLLAFAATQTEKPAAAPARGEEPLGRAGLETALTTHLAVPGKVTACLILGLDEPDDLADRLGHRGMQKLLETLLTRASGCLRAQDRILVLEDGTIGVALAPAARMDLETLLGLGARLQEAVAAPVPMDAATVYATVSVGFVASDRLNDATAIALSDAAESAMIEARRAGPGAMRVYSPQMHRAKVARHALMDEARDALELGHILPWFQPQISTDTGAVTGFEALARWQHPERGMISPPEFLPALERAGLMDRLGEVMLYHAFTALRAWDRAGKTVPSVGVNFSAAELRNPTLLDRIAWELDRFDLDAGRLTVEVLESVIATSQDDMTQRNIAGLAGLGCTIDLDDFGTGHASITSLRQFAISRIKIDRSFVMKVDQDRDQQQMVSAILTMAEQLGLDTLAEGIETAGEHSMLAQLGCGNVQGYGIGRPMPFADTLDWLHAHDKKLSAPPLIRGAGRLS